MALSLFSLFLLFQAAVTCCSSASRQISYNQVDHDAALRASLTTLLSIGAAAGRSLQKRQERTTPGNNDPIPLRFFPESELLPPAAAPAHSYSTQSSSLSAGAAEKESKRKRKAPPKPSSQISRKKKLRATTKY
jgi:hypothetical protein